MKRLLPLALLLSSPLVFGETFPDVPPPTAPFVAPVPARCAWTLEVQNNPRTTPPATPGAAPRPDNRITEVQSTQVGDVRRDIVVMGETGRDERWYLSGVVFWTTAQHQVDAAQTAPPDAADPYPSISKGFPGVQWASLATYDAPVRFEKTICYHYAKTGREAWIDATTRMPVAYRGPDALCRYTFGPPPEGALVPPPAYQAAMDQYRKIASHITPAN